MPIATPPVWTDPASATVDVVNGAVWSVDAIDAICSDLKVLGGTDGASGLASRPSLLVNGGLEIWQRGSGPFTSGYTADRWSITAATSTAAVTRETTTVDMASTASLKIVATFAAGGSCFLSQPVEDVAQLRGRTITFSCRVNTTVAGVTAFIADSGGSAGGNPNTTLNTWETISVTKVVSSSATTLSVQVAMPSVTTTVFVDNCMLVIGGTAALYSPLHPADEWMRCQRYYEIIGFTGSSVIVAGIATAGGQTAYAMLPYKAEKPVVPTITRQGTWSLTNATGQPTVTGDQTACYLALTSTAAGQFSALNNVANTWVVVEANP